MLRSQHPSGFASSSKDGNYRMGVIHGQIKIEFQAAMQYTLMGANFSLDSINLEGYSKFSMAMLMRRGNMESYQIPETK